MMINDQVQKQQSGDGSLNLQAVGDINIGLSYSEVKEIALDVFKANCIQLSKFASEIAMARVEEITENFLKKLKEENETAISELQQPGMQAALYEAQKQYAKTGNKDLENLLVDILVERASIPERNLHQIVLDESLAIASKLTTEQMDALTVNFVVSRTINHELVDPSALKQYFHAELTDSTSCYDHLDYVRCASISHLAIVCPIEKLFRLNYPGLFSKGFDKNQLENQIGFLSDYEIHLIPCFHDPSKVQFNTVNIDVFKKNLEQDQIPRSIIDKISSFYQSTTMNDIDIKEYILKEAPEIHKLFEIWEKSPISKLTLNPVGIAIAQANYRRRTGIKLELSTWIN